jgi:hypothetical protein
MARRTSRQVPKDLRGPKGPTLDKIDELADGMNVHPLTLLLLTYAGSDKPADVERLLHTVNQELKAFCDPKPAPDADDNEDRER